MKRMLLITAAAAALCGFGNVAMSQQSGVVQTTTGESATVDYIVQYGDNCWDLAKKFYSDPYQCPRLIAANPTMMKPGQVYAKANMYFAMLRPGEHLKVPIYDAEAPTPVVADEQVPGSSAAINTNPADGLVVTGPPIHHDFQVPDWAWELAVALGIATILGLFVANLHRRREEEAERHRLYADPVTSGPPIVPGGVDATGARRRFEEMGARQRFDIIEQVAGYANGLVTVAYANGTSEPRILSNRRAFRARVRFADGHEEELFMLQECGNDLRTGGVTRYVTGPGFTFTPDPIEEAAPAPQPEVAPAEPEPVAVPAPVEPEPTPVAQVEDGTVTFEFQRPKTEDDNHMVRLKGIEVESFTFSIGAEGTVLRYREVAKLPTA